MRLKGEDSIDTSDAETALCLSFMVILHYTDCRKPKKCFSYKYLLVATPFTIYTDSFKYGREAQHNSTSAPDQNVLGSILTDALHRAL